MIPFPFLLLLGLVLVAAGFDLRTRRIPNWLSVSGVCAGLAWGLIAHGWPGLAQAALGLGLALAIYVPLYALRGMGAGDVKLMAAAGALIGPGDWLFLFLATCVAGGLLALLVVLGRGRLGVTLLNTGALASALLHGRLPQRERPSLNIHHRDAVTLPHAVSIATGSLCLIVWRTWGGGM